MPAGGAKFMDNAWYFGTDVTGMVVVRLPDGGLVMFDALTTPADMQAQTLDQMKTIGLDPAKVKYVFIGHEHGDHYGGVNLVRSLAPGALVVASTPAAASIAAARTSAETRTYTGTPAEQAAAKAARLFAIPDKIDITVDAFAGVATGMKRVKVAEGVEVVSMLAPGHTLGQMNVIVPVVHQGQTRKLLIWSGNDSIQRADQYAASTDFVADLGIKEGADSFINTHGYQSAIFGHLRKLKANAAAPNPMLMGTEGLRRYFGIYANCQRALAQRVRDGTWQAM